MPKIFGTILKKQRIGFEGKYLRVDLIIQQDILNQFCIQTRPSNFYKIVDLDTGDYVEVEYRNQISENGHKTFNNLILQTIKKIT